MQIIQFRQDHLETGRIHFETCHRLQCVRLRPSTITGTSNFDTERNEITGFIENIDRIHYDACLVVDYPHHISLSSDSGELLAAAGFRFAATEPPFLEKYSSASIEEDLGVDRNRIAEIGNLTSTGQGGSKLLFMALACHLANSEISHAVMTCTTALAPENGPSRTEATSDSRQAPPKSSTCPSPICSTLPPRYMTWSAQGVSGHRSNVLITSWGGTYHRNGRNQHCSAARASCRPWFAAMAGPDAAP